jgi:hypothetical protein
VTFFVKSRVSIASLSVPSLEHSSTGVNYLSPLLFFASMARCVLFEYDDLLDPGELSNFTKARGFLAGVPGLLPEKSKCSGCMLSLLSYFIKLNMAVGCGW